MSLAGYNTFFLAKHIIHTFYFGNVSKIDNFLTFLLRANKSVMHQYFSTHFAPLLKMLLEQLHIGKGT